MRAISIMQPWAWLIVNGHKDVENRTWLTRVPGRVLIHAGKRLDREALEDLRAGIHPVSGRRMVAPFDLPLNFARGGIVGEAEIVGCVSQHPSEWFVGPYGFLLREARPLPFRPCLGALGFFEVEGEAS